MTNVSARVGSRPFGRLAGLDPDPEQDVAVLAGTGSGRRRRAPRRCAVSGGGVVLVEGVDPFLDPDAGRVGRVAVGDVALGDGVRGGVDVHREGRDGGPRRSSTGGLRPGIDIGRRRRTASAGGRRRRRRAGLMVQSGGGGCPPLPLHSTRRSRRLPPRGRPRPGRGVACASRNLPAGSLGRLPADVGGAAEAEPAGPGSVPRVHRSGRREDAGIAGSSRSVRRALQAGRGLYRPRVRRRDPSCARCAGSTPCPQDGIDPVHRRRSGIREGGGEVDRRDLPVEGGPVFALLEDVAAGRGSRDSRRRCARARAWPVDQAAEVGLRVQVRGVDIGRQVRITRWGISK